MDVLRQTREYPANAYASVAFVNSLENRRVHCGTLKLLVRGVGGIQHDSSYAGSFLQTHVTAAASGVEFLRIFPPGGCTRKIRIGTHSLVSPFILSLVPAYGEFTVIFDEFLPSMVPHHKSIASPDIVCKCSYPILFEIGEPSRLPLAAIHVATIHVNPCLHSGARWWQQLKCGKRCSYSNIYIAVSGTIRAFGAHVHWNTVENDQKMLGKSPHVPLLECPLVVIFLAVLMCTGSDICGIAESCLANFIPPRSHAKAAVDTSHWLSFCSEFARTCTEIAETFSTMDQMAIALTNVFQCDGDCFTSNMLSEILLSRDDSLSARARIVTFVQNVFASHSTFSSILLSLVEHLYVGIMALTVRGDPVAESTFDPIAFSPLNRACCADTFQFCLLDSQLIAIHRDKKAYSALIELERDEQDAMPLFREQLANLVGDARRNDIYTMTPTRLKECFGDSDLWSRARRRMQEKALKILRGKTLLVFNNYFRTVSDTSQTVNSTTSTTASAVEASRSTERNSFFGCTVMPLPSEALYRSPFHIFGICEEYRRGIGKNTLKGSLKDRFMCAVTSKPEKPGPLKPCVGVYFSIDPPAEFTRTLREHLVSAMCMFPGTLRVVLDGLPVCEVSNAGFNERGILLAWHIVRHFRKLWGSVNPLVHVAFEPLFEASAHMCCRIYTLGGRAIIPHASKSGECPEPEGIDSSERILNDRHASVGFILDAFSSRIRDGSVEFLTQGEADCLLSKAQNASRYICSVTSSVFTPPPGYFFRSVFDHDECRTQAKRNNLEYKMKSQCPRPAGDASVIIDMIYGDSDETPQRESHARKSELFCRNISVNHTLPYIQRPLVSCVPLQLFRRFFWNFSDCAHNLTQHYENVIPLGHGLQRRMADDYNSGSWGHIRPMSDIVPTSHCVNGLVAMVRGGHLETNEDNTKRHKPALMRGGCANRGTIYDDTLEVSPLMLGLGGAALYHQIHVNRRQGAQWRTNTHCQAYSNYRVTYSRFLRSGVPQVGMRFYPGDWLLLVGKTTGKNSLPPSPSLSIRQRGYFLCEDCAPRDYSSQFKDWLNRAVDDPCEANIRIWFESSQSIVSRRFEEIREVLCPFHSTENLPVGDFSEYFSPWMAVLSILGYLDTDDDGDMRLLAFFATRAVLLCGGDACAIASSTACALVAQEADSCVHYLLNPSNPSSLERRLRDANCNEPRVVAVLDTGLNSIKTGLQEEALDEKLSIRAQHGGTVRNVQWICGGGGSVRLKVTLAALDSSSGFVTEVVKLSIGQSGQKSMTSCERFAERLPHVASGVNRGVIAEFCMSTSAVDNRGTATFDVASLSNVAAKTATLLNRPPLDQIDAKCDEILNCPAASRLPISSHTGNLLLGSVAGFLPIQPLKYDSKKMDVEQSVRKNMLAGPNIQDAMGQSNRPFVNRSLNASSCGVTYIHICSKCDFNTVMSDCRDNILPCLKCGNAQRGHIIEANSNFVKCVMENIPAFNINANFKVG